MLAHCRESIARLKKVREGAVIICGIAFFLKLRICTSKQFF